MYIGALGVTLNMTLVQMAQRYKEANEDLEKENTSLYDQLTQAKMSDMVSSTQSLATVAYEFDKEVVMTKLAQAEEMMAYGAEMQERIHELEEENDALKQTLHEIREDQKQMHALREMASPADIGIGESDVPVYGSPQSEKESSTGQEQAAVDGDGAESTPVRDQSYMSESSSYATPLNSTKKDDPIVIADALAAVAAGSESGMAASASKMLRGYHSMQAELEEVKAKNVELAKEVEELTETMTSKQFKAPSAWAEREVKYKLEKKEWEEEVEDKVARIRALESENEMLRSEKGTDDLNEKIVELESEIVVLSNKYQDAKASLHDMHVSSLVSAGEFSMSGVKPVAHEDDVRSIVDKIESESESHEASSSRQRETGEEHAMQEELVQLQREKEEIISKISQAEEADATTTLLAEAEIALLESGIDMEDTAKIMELEGKLHQSDIAVDNVQEQALSVAPVLKKALAAPSPGVLQSLKVAEYVDNTSPPEISDDNATTAPELEEEVRERIADLKLQIHVGQPEEDTPAMPASAAAGMAAVNRAQNADIQQLKSQLQEAAQREEELQRRIEQIKVRPVNIRLSQASTLSSSSPRTANLASERKNADKAWEDHQKKSDVTSILREKAELEAKHDMAKSQVSKLRDALESANQEKQALQKAIKHALATGDMATLSAAHENYAKKKKASSPLKKLRGRGIFSRKSGSRPGSAQDEAPPTDAENLRFKPVPAPTDLPSPSTSMLEHEDPAMNKHIHALEEENEMLMDQLVTAKVRLAEVEGDCLESRRALVRAKEKQMDLARQLHDQRVSHA